MEKINEQSKKRKGNNERKMNEKNWQTRKWIKKWENEMQLVSLTMHQHWLGGGAFNNLQDKNHNEFNEWST